MASRFLTITPPTQITSSPASATSTFDDLVASYQMPPPGPDFYQARRQLWLTPRTDEPRLPLDSQSIPPSRAKLERVLQTPGAVYSDTCWKVGVEQVWKGLCRGESLKYRLPLNLIIRVVHASWVRDETWPANMRAPEPDDELPGDFSPEPIVLEQIQNNQNPGSSASPPGAQ